MTRLIRALARTILTELLPLSVFPTVAGGFSDHKAGFGGTFGVQSERQDSCAVGFEYKERLAKHESQQGIVAHQPPPPPAFWCSRF